VYTLRLWLEAHQTGIVLDAGESYEVMLLKLTLSRKLLGSVKYELYITEDSEDESKGREG